MAKNLDSKIQRSIAFLPCGDLVQRGTYFVALTPQKKAIQKNMPDSSQFDAVGTSSTQPNADASSSERVRTACAYGNYEQLTAAVEEDSELLSTPDEMGYYPLQWAALNNRVGIIAYLIDKGVNVNRWAVSPR